MKKRLWILTVMLLLPLVWARESWAQPSASNTSNVITPRAARYVYLTNFVSGNAGLDSATNPAVAVVRDQLLVRFRPATPASRRQQIISGLGGRAKDFGQPSSKAARVRQSKGAVGRPLRDDLAVVQLDSGTDLGQALANFRSQPEVLYVEPNYRLHITDDGSSGVFPNDFDFAQLWGLHNVGQGDGTAGADIGMAAAWAYGTGDRSVVVAVIDTGIDYYHPDLADNVWTNPHETAGNGLDDDANGFIDDLHGYDFVSDDGDPMDDHGHGTHVSGTIGAVGNNGIGVVGVCWRVSLMALKAFDENGDGDVSAAVAGIQYAVQNGARIINASWGDVQPSQALQDAINDAYQAGVLFVAAAGNNNSDHLFYPAADDHVVAVAATNANDQRSRFSDSGSFIDLAAPGENIYSTLPNNGYGYLSGTSMAAPHVSGVAALILSVHPEFSPDQLRNILRNSVALLDTDKYIGTGRLDAAAGMRVNSPLPEVALRLPDTISGQIDIAGMATGNQFTGYVLEYGTGSNPTNWTTLLQSASAVPDGTLFQNFSTAALGQGTYTFRLSAKNAAGERAVERASVLVNNVYISSPNHEDVRRAGEKMDIIGTVYGGGRVYRVQYGVGPAPATWSDAGLALSNAGQIEVQNGLLATWDTSQVPPNQFYTLKLTATASDGSVEEFVTQLVYLDSHLKPGWPQYIPVTGDYPLEDWRQVTVADIDNDGFDEIILVDHGTSLGDPAHLLVYRHDGSLFWSKELASGAPYADLPAVGDIDGDGFMEIFVDVGSDDRVMAFRHDGTPLPGNWPVQLQGSGGFGKVIADLAGDGKKELICYSQTQSADGPTRHLFVLDQAGVVLRDWHLLSCGSSQDVPRLLPAVGNLDSDPDQEIVAVWGCGSVAAFKWSQPSSPIWTANTSGTFVSSPVIGDLDGDGTNEVVIAASDPAGGNRGGLFAFNNRGEALPGWPVLVQESFLATPALADVDGDGQLEISIPSWKTGLLHLVRPDGFEAQGWPVGPLKSSSLKSMTVIGDVDGDGRPDIVLSSPGYTSQVLGGDLTKAGGIMAWNGNGQPIPLNGGGGLLPLVMESPSGVWMKAGPAALADLEHRGKLDIIAPTVEDRTYVPLGQKAVWKFRSSLYVWELDSPYVPENFPWPTFQQNPQHTGLFQRKPHVDQPPVVAGIPDQIVPPGSTFFPIGLDEYEEDPDNTAPQISWSVTGNQQLQVTINNRHVANVQPPGPAWVGREVLHFVARDPAGLQSVQDVSFEVRPGYVPPVAAPDDVTTLEGVAVEIDVLANDTDPAGNSLSIQSFSRPALGKVTRSTDGTLRYVPNTYANGTDGFTYVLSNGQGGMALGFVTLHITPVNNPPLANTDYVLTDEDTPCAIDVLANDTDPDNDAILLTAFTQPAHGVIARDAANLLEYLPLKYYFGSDTFTYGIADGHGGTNQGTVNIIVKPVNHPPVAQNQAFTLNRNSSVTVTFKAVDPEDTQFTFTVVDGPQHGALWTYPQVATYYPTNGFSGVDQFTYKANDGKDDGPLATVTFTVLNVNNPPDAQSQAILTKVDQAVNIGLAATDLDNDPLTFIVTMQPSHGQLTGSGTNYLYQPDPGFLGPDAFSFRAYDGKSFSQIAKVTITVTDQNTPPVANDFTLRVLVNTPTNITLQARDAESDPLSFHLLTKPAHGKLTGKGGVLLFSPAAYYQGPDRFTFKANDGQSDSNVGTVTLNIDTANHPPITTHQQLVVLQDTPTPVRLDVQDPDGDALKCPILKGPQHGMLSGLGVNFTYVPKPGYVGSDSFTYKAWDGQTYSAIGIVGIDVRTPPPPAALSFLSITAGPAGEMRLAVAAPANLQAQVLVSTNLVSWTTLSPTPIGSGTNTVVDPDAPKYPHRFYRLSGPK